MMVIVNKQKLINLVLVLITFLALLFSAILFYKTKNITSDINFSNQKEIKDLKDKISNIYLIPQNEDPTVATVSDPDVLKGQSFFASAQKGDRVLIFTKSGKAVLYRPSIEKIVEITSIEKKNSPSTSTNGPIQNESF